MLHLSKMLTTLISMSKPVGGRGKKAAYTSTHVRVPEPLVSEVEALKRKFFGVEEEEAVNPLPTLENAMAIAKGILLNKKSAKLSLEKLLTALYNTQVKL